MAYSSPYITGQYNPVIYSKNDDFAHCSNVKSRTSLCDISKEKKSFFFRESGLCGKEIYPQKKRATRIPKDLGCSRNVKLQKHPNPGSQGNDH